MVEPGICEPQDVIANRLDPWHGAWFHPYAFSHLTVDDEASDEHRLIVDVTFRLSRTWGVPVRAEFSCPDTRTIVMRIIDGEGTGSVVETHATPTGVDEQGRPITMVTEATIAYSDRPGFSVARFLTPLLRPSHRQDGQAALGGRPRLRRAPLRPADARRVPRLKMRVSSQAPFGRVQQCLR